MIAAILALGIVAATLAYVVVAQNRTIVRLTRYDRSASPLEAAKAELVETQAAGARGRRPRPTTSEPPTGTSPTRTLNPAEVV